MKLRTNKPSEYERSGEEFLSAEVIAGDFNREDIFEVSGEIL